MYYFRFLKQNYEFHRAYRKGKSFVCPYFVLYVVKGHGDSIGMGITVSKKLGTAVKRNRAKRVLRAAFCTVSGSTKKGLNYVLVARSKILSVKTPVVADCLFEFLKDL